MYPMILQTLTNWLFGSMPLEPWQMSFVAISAITVIAVFCIAVTRAVWSWIGSLFRW